MIAKSKKKKVENVFFSKRPRACAVNLASNCLLKRTHAFNSYSRHTISVCDYDWSKEYDFERESITPFFGFHPIFIFFI